MSVPIDSYLKSFYDFKNGSYWVYKNMLQSNMEDSMILTKYFKDTFTRDSMSGNQKFIKIYDRVTYSIVSKSGSWNTLNFYVVDKNITMSYDNTPFGGLNSQCNNCLLEDSVALGNGKVYYNTITQEFHENRLVNNHISNVLFVSDCINTFAPGVGLIKRNSSHESYPVADVSYELLRHHVIPN
jgi:hypothetical protein